MNLKSLFEKDKAILSQKVDHMEIQLREAKKREAKLKESYQKMIDFVQGLRDGGRAGNAVFLEGCRAGLFASGDRDRDRDPEDCEPESARRSTAQFAEAPAPVICDDC